MTSEENNQRNHQKHTNIERPALGNFGRYEWAIVGAPCETIKVLSGKIIKILSPVYKCAYIDTAHSNDLPALPGCIANGAAIEVTDKIDFTQVNYQKNINTFKYRGIFSDADLVLANGNHHEAKAQVIVLNKSKKASLQKRIAQLNNIQMILLDDVNDIFDFIKEAIPNWSGIPIYRLDETEKITGFFKRQLEKGKPKLNGLVLAGGKSERMGFDKALIKWHGKEQRYYMADMLSGFCDEVFISCRLEQQIETHYTALPDTFTGLGPFGAILSAFRERPDEAWLVVACDLPLLIETSLRYLVDNRDISTIATAYQSSFNDFPEPLITIWEPKSYPVLLAFLAQGYSCPRKVLINSDITLLQAPNQEEFTNVNTPEEFAKAKLALHQKVAAE